MKKLFLSRAFAFTILLLIGGCSANPGAVDPVPDLPIRGNTASYPDLTLAELVKEADCIFYAKVSDVGETRLDLSAMPVTPMTLSVIETLKGDPVELFTFYRDGGKTAEYIMKSSSFEMTAGMEAVFFTNKHGFGWGPIGVWLTAGDTVALHWDVFQKLEMYNIETKEEDLTKYAIASLIDPPEAYKTCSLADFTGLLRSLVNSAG